MVNPAHNPIQDGIRFPLFRFVNFGNLRKQLGFHSDNMPERTIVYCFIGDRKVDLPISNAGSFSRI